MSAFKFFSTTLLLCAVVLYLSLPPTAAAQSTEETATAATQTEDETVDYINMKLKSANQTDPAWFFDAFQKVEDHVYLLTQHTIKQVPGMPGSATDYFGYQFDMRKMDAFTAAQEKFFLSDESGIMLVLCAHLAGNCITSTECFDACTDRTNGTTASLWINIGGLASEDQIRVRRAYLHLKELSPTSIPSDPFDGPKQ